MRYPMVSSLVRLVMFCLEWYRCISDSRLSDIAELAVCHDLEVLTITSKISLLIFFEEELHQDTEGPSLEELAHSFVGKDCHAFEGNIPKLCIAINRQARGRVDFRGRSFSQWPRPCAIYVHGTSMGAKLHHNTSFPQVNLSEEPQVLHLPRRLTKAVQQRNAKGVRQNDAQLLARLFVEEMRFAKSSPEISREGLTLGGKQNFNELLLRLRALECDARFMESLFNAGNGDGRSWGLIFAHSFIQDLMLGPLRRWTDQVRKSQSSFHVAVLGSNSGNEVFYIANSLGLPVVGYELRCDLVELSRALAKRYLPDADIDFRCEDAMQADLSKAWIVILDNEAWDYSVSTKVFASMAMGPLPVGAAVVTFRSGATDGLCDLEDHLKQLGWMRHAGATVKTTWELDPDPNFPSAIVWKKTDGVRHRMETSESPMCLSEEDVDQGEDEWMARNAQDL